MKGKHLKNIFQGNILINKKVADILGCKNEEDIKYGWFTQDIYFETFFYLTKRFGDPVIYDDYKDAGTWHFKVKDFAFHVYMNSSWVNFIIFGKIGNFELYSPATVKYQRRWRDESDKLIRLFSDEHNDKEKAILKQLFDKFKEENHIDEEKITDEEFDEKYSYSWYKFVNEYNNTIINVDFSEFTKKYGEVYQNAYTRRALRVLEKFLKNMLIPIYVRDVPYNIKGRISDEEANFYSRYENNIEIIFEEK